MEHSNKRILLTLFCFFVLAYVSSTHAFLNMPGGGGVFTYPAGGSCDDCSGTRVISSHFEDNSGHDIETGTPCGCTDGTDTTFSGGTYNAESSDGSYSLQSTDTERTIDMANVSTLEEEGTITFDIYLTENATANPATIVNLENTTNTDYIQVQLLNTASSNDLKIIHEKNGWGTGTATVVAGLSTSTWYSVTAQYKVGGSPNTLSIAANSQTGTSSDTLYGTWANDIDVLKCGHEGGDAVTYYLDIVDVSTGSSL